MKYLSIVRWALMLISALTIILYFAGAVTDVDMMLNWAYIVLGIAVVCVIVFPAFTLAQNPKGAVRSLIGLLILAVVLGVCYALGSDETVVTAGEVYTNRVALKVTDMGLFATYIALFVAVASIIVCEIRNSFK